MNTPDTVKQPDNQEPKKQGQGPILVVLAEAGIEFAVIIAVPLIAGILAGQWMDNKYHKSFFVIIGILLGIFVTVVAIASRIKDYKKLLEKKVKS